MKISGTLGVCGNLAGDLFISVYDTNMIKKVSGGYMSTVAGTSGFSGSSGDGGPPLNALISGPYQVHLDSSSNVYFGGSDNRVRKMYDPSPSSQPSRQPSSQPSSMFHIDGMIFCIIILLFIFSDQPTRQPSSQPSMPQAPIVFSNYVTMSSQIVSNMTLSSLDNVMIGSAYFTGSAINGGGTGYIVDNCLVSADAPSITTRRYLFYVQNGGDLKWVLVRFTIVSSKLQVVAEGSGRRSTGNGFMPSCTDVNLALTSPTTSGASVATCQTCGGYGLSNIELSYTVFHPSSQPSRQPSSHPSQPSGLQLSFI
jgi:hypothetical protein